MKYLLLALFLVTLAILVYVLFIQDIEADAYHTTPIAAQLDAGLYGKEVDSIAVSKPFLYMQRKSDENSGCLLNVLLPIPRESHLVAENADYSTPRTVRFKYTFESNFPAEGTAGFYQQTLIPIGRDISTIIVECGIAGGGSGTSTIHTDDADTEDPIKGGPATPYMNGYMESGLLVYNGGRSTTVVIAPPPGISDLRTVTMDIPDAPQFQTVSGRMPDHGSLTIGKRTIKGVQ